jgi:hypothetical protein
MFSCESCDPHANGGVFARSVPDRGGRHPDTSGHKNYGFSLVNDDLNTSL